MPRWRPNTMIRRGFAASVLTSVTLQLEDGLAHAASLRDLHGAISSHEALEKKVHTLTKLSETRVSHADMQQFFESQQQQSAPLQKQIMRKVGIIVPRLG